MRATLLSLLLLAACRTSGLGSCKDDSACPTGSSCDPANHVCQVAAGQCFPLCSLGQSCQSGTCVGQPTSCTPPCPAGQQCISGICTSASTDAPRISAISILTAPDYTDPGGRAIFDSGPSPLSVRATIASATGIDASSVCLRLAGESGTCAHPGSASPAGGQDFLFQLPRPAAAFDGTSLDFVISASTTKGIASVSPVQHAYFDNQPPSVTVAGDSTSYARTLPDGGISRVLVSARISDGTGVAQADLLVGSQVVAAIGSDAGVYSFQLDPSGAPAGGEGPYSFHIRAVDHLGHDGGADATRFIDDAAPALSARIFPSDAGAGPGFVQYPAAIANTGRDGKTFIYSDWVRVQGTLTDNGGLGSATVRIDGTAIDGGFSRGTPLDLGCAAGATSCAFDLGVALNDPRNGRFHTPDGGVAGQPHPSGTLTAVIEARDSAVGGDGSAAAHLASDAGALHVTRFLWQLTPSAASFSGLAIHPNGDVIATDDAGVVFALLPDAPAPDRAPWSDALIGGITGAPVIGSGGGGTARIYAAGSDGGIVALDPGLGVVWEVGAGAAARFSVSPALYSLPDGGDEVIVPDNVNNNASHRLWSTAGAAPAGVASLGRDRWSAPMVLSSGVWFSSDDGGVEWHSIGSDGAIGALVVVDGTQGSTWFGPITDGVDAFAGTRDAGPAGTLLVRMTPSHVVLPTGAIPQALAAEPTIGSDGKIFFSDTASGVSEFDPASGGVTTLVPSLGAGTAGGSPLHGWDGKNQPGHFYLPRTGGMLFAFEGGQVSWQFRAPGTPLRALAMDCSGRLFFASNSLQGPNPASATIYAFVTDDRGLADTPWPSMRRDSRNTGNSGAPPWGIRRALGGDCTQ